MKTLGWILWILFCLPKSSWALFSFWDNQGLPLSDSSELRDEVKNWTVEQKLGQLLMVGYRNLAQIREIQPSGVVLFSWSMKDPEQTRQLTEELRSYSRRYLKAPLFIATDHEGGRVLRLRRGMTGFPDAAALGSNQDDLLAFRVGKAMGLELSSLGINMNLAPVLDLGNARTFLGNRVWGDEGQSVGRLTRAFIRGLFSSRVLAVAKHFPGHGGTNVDAHFALPVVNKSRDELWEQDLVPFKKVIQDGVPVVMSAHVEIPVLGKGPASLSKEFLTNILRHQLGFKGLVLTDDLEMGGAIGRNQRTVEDAALESLKAGTDILLVVWNRDTQRRILKRLRQALKEGEITEDWLNDKVARIQMVKRQYLSAEKWAHSNPFWKSNLRRPESLGLARRIAHGAVQWVGGNEDKILQRLYESWNQSWSVWVPDVAAQKLWAQFRPRDATNLLVRRPDSRELQEFQQKLEFAQTRGPVLVVTAPRPQSSEEVFEVVKNFFGRQTRVTTKAQLWVHQGPRPVEVRQPASDLQVGLLSLHSSSIESWLAFQNYLKKETDASGRGSHDWN